MSVHWEKKIVTSFDLILVRHAIAEERRIGLPEADRKLTETGISRFKRLAEGYRQLGFTPKEIWTSPWERAAHTANLLADVFPGSPTTLQPALASSPGPDLLNAIAAAEFPLILVGHEPWLTQLAGILTIGRAESLFRLKKGGLIWLQGEAEAAGMLTKIVLAPAPTLNLLDTQG